ETYTMSLHDARPILYYSLVLLQEMAREVFNDPALEEEMKQRAARIKDAIDKHAWDGNWYLAGYSDFGNPVGSASNKEGRVYLNTDLKSTRLNSSHVK